MSQIHWACTQLQAGLWFARWDAGSGRRCLKTFENSLKPCYVGGLIMRTWLATAAFITRGMGMKLSAVAALLTVGAATALAQPAGEAGGGEAALKLPDLSQVSFFNGAIDGDKLLLSGILFCLFGLGIGMAIYMRLKNLPVHRAMREISELIYETCKTYLVTQGKFILVLGAVI